jgi:hypothetical protein
VSRRQDYEKIRENFAFLSSIGTVHTHADLIAGLPGETIESFAVGFDAVSELAPDEIQLGILKRLKGTPITRHDQEWEMVYQAHPPFQVLQTKTMSFLTLQRLARFSHFWDLIANSGNFKRTHVLLLELSRQRQAPSLFWEFDEFASFLSTRHPEGHSVALLNLLESVWIYLKEHKKLDEERVRSILLQDYTSNKMRSTPQFLKSEADLSKVKVEGQVLSPISRATPVRQRRHLESFEEA